MVQFLKGKILYNRKTGCIVSFLRKIIAVLAIFSQAFVEIRDALFVCRKTCDDRDFLGYNIRRNAHMLEKLIKKLDTGFKHSVEYGSMIAGDLENELAIWERKNYGDCVTIKWAKKIRAEYRGFRKSEFTCTQVGKVGPHKKQNDLLSIMKNRRSIRQWENEPVPMEKIELLIDAARWAPSSCNRQTCHFIIVNDINLIKKVGKSVKGGRFFFDRVPLLIIVINDVRPYNLPQEKYIVYQDAAAAIQNILLMTHEQGLGACWGAYTSGSGIIHNERVVRKLLKIPDFFRITGIVAIGVALELPCLIPRKDYRDIIYLNKYA